jgi:hypothetical protein
MLGVRFPVPHIKGELHERAKALLGRSECLLDAPTARAELAQQYREADENEEAQPIIGRQLERIHWRDEPVQGTRRADQCGEQAGSASAIPGTQHHCGDGKLVDAGAFPQRKPAAEEKREAGQCQGKAIACKQIARLCRHPHRCARRGRNRRVSMKLRKRRLGFRFFLQVLGLHDSSMPTRTLLTRSRITRNRKCPTVFSSATARPLCVTPFCHRRRAGRYLRTSCPRAPAADQESAALVALSS